MLIVLVGLVYLLFAPLLVPFWWLPMLWLVWVAGFLLMRRVGKRSSWLMLGAAPSLYLLFGAFVVILSEAGYRAPY